MSEPFRITPITKFALFIGLLGNAIGHTYLFVALPLLARQMGFSDVQAGALLSLGALGYLVAAPVWGYLTEKFGRRPVLLIGLFAAAIAPVLFASLIQSRLSGAFSIAIVFSGLILIRLVQSLMTGGLLPAAQAFIADGTSGKDRIRGMGMMAAAFGLGSILGAVLLWSVATLNILWGFYIIAAFCVLASIVNWLKFPEPLREASYANEAQERASQKHEPQKSGTEKSIAWRMVWPCLVVTILGVTTYSILHQITGLRLQDVFALSAQEASGQAGKIMALTATGMVFAQAIILQVLRIAPLRLMQLGAVLAIGALMGLAHTQDYTTIIALMVGLGISLGLMLPANLAILSLLTGRNAQGKTAGVNAMGQGLGMVIGPLLAALLYQKMPSLPYWGAALLLALVVFISLFLPSSNQSAKAKAS